MKNLVKISNVLVACVALALVITPFMAAAQFTLPNPEGTGLGGGLSGETSVTAFIFRIINIALALAGLIAVLYLVIGGFRYITAGGNEDAAGSAKKIILNAVIGIIVIILSFVIVRVVSSALTANTI